MRADVSGIHEALAVGLHDECVGVEGAVVDEDRRDAVGAELERHAVLEVPGGYQRPGTRDEEAGYLRDASRAAPA